MKQSDVDEMVSEFAAVWAGHEDPELKVVEAAMFAEECFGLCLTDGDFTRENLGGPKELRAFLRRRLGV